MRTPSLIRRQMQRPAWAILEMGMKHHNSSMHWPRMLGGIVLDQLFAQERLRGGTVLDSRPRRPVEGAQ